MQRHKLTRIKRKYKSNKSNAAAAKMEQRHDFPRPRTRKNFQAKDRAFEDMYTRGEIEVGSGFRSFLAGMQLECSIFSKIRNRLELECSLSAFTVQISIFSSFSVNLFRFEICWSKVLPKSLGVGLKSELLKKKLEWSCSRKFAIPLHSQVHSRSRTKKFESKVVLEDSMSPFLCI